MKLFLTALLASTAAAFAPASISSSTSSLSAKVPLDGGMPLLGSESLFIGETYWDKLTSEWGSADTGTFLRAAEIKHGRSAMLAVTGFAFHKLGLTFNNISPHEYLSVTEGVKFADLAAMSPVDAVHAIPAAGLTQIFMTIAAVEIYELTHGAGGIANGERIAPGLKAGGLTGDLGWNPLKINVTERRKHVEIQNGRAAMFAICAWVSADAIPGSVPIPLPW